MTRAATIVLCLSTLAWAPLDASPAGAPSDKGAPRDLRSTPMQLNHQGVVLVAGQRFNGNGFFRFALVDSSTGINAWTNDGTHVGATGMPTAAVGLVVINGIYNVGLGDTSHAVMVPLTTSAFNIDNLVLRIWFDDGVNGVQLLSPDQKLTTAPYAFRAANGAIVGEVKMWAGSVASIPPGYRLCDGTSLNKDDYPQLFAAIGTIYGGNGNPLFNLPDFRNRSPMGVSQDSSGIPVTTVTGQVTQLGGEAAHQLSVAEMPNHTHSESAFVMGNPSITAPGGGGNRDGSTQTGAAGGSQPHNNIHPYFAITYIIYAGQ